MKPGPTRTQKFGFGGFLGFLYEVLTLTLPDPPIATSLSLPQGIKVKRHLSRFIGEILAQESFLGLYAKPRIRK